MKKDRFCIDCGKKHNTGVENKIEETFEPIDKCIDCLMSKCSFKFQDTQITLNETEFVSHEEM